MLSGRTKETAIAVLKAKPEKIIDFYLATLRQGLVSPLVVTRANSNDFKGALNDTVTMRIGGLKAVARDYTFRDRTAPIQFDDIQGGEGITIKLDTHTYSATGLTDEHMTLDSISLGEEVIAPQVAAVTERFEAKVMQGLAGARAKASIAFGADDDPHLVTLEAKRQMDRFKVAPRENRSFLVGSDIAAAFLASDRLSRYDSTGLEGTPALRQAIIGSLAGSPVIEVPELDPGKGYYIHKTAIVLGNVAPVVPTGATAGRTGISKDGFAVRWIQDYDPNFLRDRSIVSSFLGVNDVRDERNEDGTLVAEEDRQNVRVIPLTMTGDGQVFDGVTVDGTLTP